MDKFEFKKRILFLGVPDMAYVGLDTLLFAGVNIVGVIGPRTTHNTYDAFKNFVNSRKQNFIEYNQISDDELIDKIKDMDIDAAVVCSFNDKLPKKFIDTTKDGIINIHPSLLPKYRGGNPYSRVIMNGETETGVTLHFMSEDFDKGDIIAQQVCKLDPKENMGTLFNKTNRIGCEMLLKILIYYEQHNSLPRKSQPEGTFIMAPNIKDQERYINYDKTAIETERLVRALNPYILACTLFKNQYMMIHKVSIADVPDVENFANGEICRIENNKVYIKTAKGCIVPEIMQYSGYFIGDCSDFIRIVNPQIGDKFQNGYT